MFDPARILSQIEARMAELGMTQAQLGLKAFGKEDNTAIQSLKKGSSPAIDRLAAMANALGLEIYFGSPREHATTKQMMIDGSDYVQVALHDAELSAGPGSTNGDRNIVEHLAFRRDWLRNIGLSASDAVLARASGDSMLPTIHGGDIVLIDRRVSALPTKVRDPKDTRPLPIYAILDDGSARLKRLALATRGTIALLSDNPECPPEFRPVTTLSVIGKVMWWGHTNKET